MTFWREASKGRGGERHRHKRKKDGWNEREERLARREGGLGRAKKLSRSSVMCEHSTNPGFIGCLCPATLSGLSVCVRDSGGLRMSLLREESLRKSRTWLRPFSGRLRNIHHRGPVCILCTRCYRTHRLIHRFRTANGEMHIMHWCRFNPMVCFYHLSWGLEDLSCARQRLVHLSKR